MIKLFNTMGSKLQIFSMKRHMRYFVSFIRRRRQGGFEELRRQSDNPSQVWLCSSHLDGIQSCDFKYLKTQKVFALSILLLL